MVLLSTFALITAIGLGLFITGYVTEYPELSVIGAVFILGAGGMALEFGLEKEVGREDLSNTAGNDTFVNINEPVDTTSRLSLGFLTMLAGGAGILRSLNRFGEAG